jgi:hypothetical protein
MDYLNQFYRDLIKGQIPMRNSYVNKTNQHPVDEKDVITDLIENNQLVSAACLPIAKQIVIFEKKVSLLIPNIGDLFIGLAHHTVIEKVTFILSNYSEEFIIDGQLMEINGALLWQLTELPILLLVIQDYVNVNLSVQITINNEYNLQNSNQDVFLVYYGYFNRTIKQELMNNVVYTLPLLNRPNRLKIICGIWYIDQMELNVIQ